MDRQGPPTFAFAAAVLVVLAGMVVLVPAAGAAPADVQTRTGVADQAGGSLASLTSASAVDSTTLADHQALYEELSTCVSTGSGPSVARQLDAEADHESGDGSNDEQRLHRWHCPICDGSKLSFGSTDVDPGEAAANNLRSHIRNTDGAGHGPQGTIPEWINRLELADSVAVLPLAD